MKVEPDKYNTGDAKEDAYFAARARKCGTKIAHKMKKAELIAFNINRKEHTDCMVAYHCEFCGRWHVGHKVGSLKRL